MKPAHHKRLPNWVIGLVMVIVLAIAAYFAFSKQLPWGKKFEVQAVFASAQNVRPSAPVRIAGVNVGKVTEVEHLSSAESDELTAEAGDGAPLTDGSASGSEAAVLTMELEDSALPLHTDARMKLRPRLFLEGNYFVDLQPGSPSAPEVDDGYTLPVNQTAYSVQLDQILTTLQGDVRKDLQTFLDQFGNALIRYGGAEGFRELYRTSPPAFKFTSQTNEALLGTHPGDLAGVIRGLDSVVRALDRNELALQDLVTNFRIVSGSFAAEDVALARAVEELPGVLEAAHPAFRSLNASFPALRAFARDALPGVRSTPAMLRAATPFIHQVRKLVSKRELRGLVHDLRPTIPKLARLAKETIPFLEESRALSSCFNEVVIPWSNDTVEPVDPLNQYPHDPVGRVFEETGYGFGGIASESRSGDANGRYIRVESGGGPNTVTVPNAVPDLTGGGTQDAVGVLDFPLIGAMPAITDSAKTPFRPRVACETQEQPNLEGTVGDLGNYQQQTLSASAAVSGLEPQTQREQALVEDLNSAVSGLQEAGGKDAPASAKRRFARRLEDVLGPLGKGGER